MAAGAKTNCANGYQSNKYGNVPKDTDFSPDLHFRMCKKIAQLTKVFCSFWILVHPPLQLTVHFSSDDCLEGR